MKNNLLKQISRLNVVYLFMVFFLLFGCKNSSEEKSIQKTTFNLLDVQQNFVSKSTTEKWEFVLEIASANYKNKEQAYNWLLKVAPKLFTDKKNIQKKILNQINRELYGGEFSEPALLFAENTFKKFHTKQDRFIHGYAAATLSNHYQDLNLYDSVNKYNLILQEALNFYDTERLKVIYFTNNANYLKKKGYLFESAVNYHKALEINNLKDSLTQFTLITNLSGIYYELNYADKAKIFIDSAKSIVPFQEWTIEALNHAGLVYSKTKDYTIAKQCFLKAIKKSADIKSPNYLAQSYANFANFNRKIKKYSQAIQYMAKSDSICKASHVDFGILINCINRAELYYDQKKYTEAARSLKLIENEIKRFNLTEINIGYYELSYRIYDALGNTNVANAYFRMYIKSKETFTGDLPRSVISEWELSREREKSIKLDDQQNLLVQKQTIKNYFYVFSIIILLMSLLVVYYIIQKKNLKAQEKLKLNHQKMAFELEIKSKELLTGSLKNISIQQYKSIIKSDLEAITKEFPIEYRTKLSGLKSKLKSSGPNSFLEDFENRFVGVYEVFYKKLNTISADLTPNELIICAMLRLNYTSKEIAYLTNRTVRTIENNRSIIRKKLLLNTEANLQQFIMNL
jgi:DNA-binding CsgD family transcriptional regulator